MDMLSLTGIAVVFVAAGATKGISGMGLPTVAIGLLGLFMPPAHAAALLVLPSLLTNLAQCVGRHFLALCALLWPMWVGILAGALLTPLPSLASGAATVRIGLGTLLIAYAAHGLARPEISLRLSRGAMLAASLVVGCVTGALTAATGVFMVPMVMFLQMLGFEKERMVQALGLSFTVCTVALGASLGWSASWQALSSVQGIVALAGALLGMWLGIQLRGRISAPAFRTMLFTVFGLLGLALIAKEAHVPADH
ncbi:sulfite exporter TauE/SafE family protein [Ramlibacter sp. AW1]|uniref:Probable membrane transporter protein n=1 Tax=Ramlibacter aurantiacus TaxID=2801330 RepID=A0A937D609_9BURK|nr:sulfite exporter TauE/SafE family protein [Ramlibacter aurantiacus]MBL0419316.1 sulfite exporter TauE/SafE family protein [Ramlibacter aurantiacus]